MDTAESDPEPINVSPNGGFQNPHMRVLRPQNPVIRVLVH